jgi:hypothetical protein
MLWLQSVSKPEKPALRIGLLSAVAVHFHPPIASHVKIACVGNKSLLKREDGCLLGCSAV